VLPNFASLVASGVKTATLSPHANAKAAGRRAEGGRLHAQGCFYALKGKQVMITITDPSNYSDYALDDQLMANQLKAAHINATFDGLSDNAWYADLADGKFGSATSHWSNTNIVPYGQYDGWLDSALDTSNASGDFEGLKNPTVDKELLALAGQTSAKGQLKALAPIEQYVASQLPVIRPCTALRSTSTTRRATAAGRRRPTHTSQVARTRRPTRSSCCISSQSPNRATKRCQRPAPCLRERGCGAIHKAKTRKDKIT